MTPKLSIIIPCYNCEKTLEEAVASCYTQDIPDDEFEIIMVDDGSSDDTRQVMKSVATKYSNISLLFHEVNKGGGAARNTGIRTAKNEIIYCLDSDNFFAPRSVRPMLKFLAENNLDGAAFYERRFFSNSNSRSFECRYNQILDRDITIEDLFSEPNIMLDNFFYTKRAYGQTNTYPEHHGFDTQTFEIDFLARKLEVRIFPKSIFYHRQNQTGHKSYYEREYERGLISINTYLALEPIMQTLHSDVIELMIFFDIYKKNFHRRDAQLRGALTSYVQSGKSLLIENSELQSPLAATYVTMCTHTRNAEYPEALTELEKCIRFTGKETPLLHYMRLRISYGLEGIRAHEIDKEVASFLVEENLLHQPKYKRMPRILKPLHKIYLHILTSLTMNKIVALPTKIKRRALSLFISFFLHKDNEELFVKTAQSAAETYANKKNTYDYAEFLMPSWKNNTEEIEAIFLAGLPFSFLRNQMLKQTMFAHLPKIATEIQKKLITDFYGKSEAQSLLHENSAGKPILNDFQYKTSGNSIHHLYHFTKFSKETKTPLKELNSVVEFGGGYGNAAKIFRKINANATYTIVDIPIFSYIQFVYLSTVFGPDKVVMFDDTEKIIKGKINIVPLHKGYVQKLNSSLNAPDLFISTWALSETNEATQSMIKKLNYFNSKSILLAYQKASDAFTFSQNIEDLPAEYHKIYQSEIAHQKENFYLFASKDKNV